MGHKMQVKTLSKNGILALNKGLRQVFSTGTRFMMEFLVNLAEGLVWYQLALRASRRARFYALHASGQ